MKLRVGIYIRVSTTDKGQDPELQLTPLRDYARARGWEFQEYVDIGESGAKDRRPALDRLMEDARKRRVDGILVVVRVGRVKRDDAMRAMGRLEQVNGNVLGVIFNDVETAWEAYYGYRANSDAKGNTGAAG